MASGVERRLHDWPRVVFASPVSCVGAPLQYRIAAFTHIALHLPRAPQRSFRSGSLGAYPRERLLVRTLRTLSSRSSLYYISDFHKLPKSLDPSELGDVVDTAVYI